MHSWALCLVSFTKDKLSFLQDQWIDWETVYVAQFSGGSQGTLKLSSVNTRRVNALNNRRNGSSMFILVNFHFPRHVEQFTEYLCSS